MQAFSTIQIIRSGVLTVMASICHARRSLIPVLPIVGMDLGRLIRQNEDLSGVVPSEESVVAPIPGGFQDVCSFSIKLL